MNYDIVKNYTLLCDFYELTMANGYYKSGLKDKICYFDMFFRSNPDKGGFAIACGLDQVIEYINNLSFSQEDIDFLRSKKIFDEEFLEYLKDFKFTGDMYAVPEGTVIFPNEPIITVKAKAIEAQIVETFILLTINHQSLIATKANRIVRAAKDRTVLEFGARRAQGPAASVLGARAAYIGGAGGTSCTLAEKMYNVPAGGTMAHSWVQMFPTEYEAFYSYASQYPKSCTLLVDTYNVLKSGVPNAIRVFKELGINDGAIRLDSGDITYLSKKSREMLDQAGLTDCKIVASNSLDEYIIRDILHQGAELDLFGVGERLITSKSDPVFGGVYKLVATEEEGEVVPKIKISENPTKITTPHFKKVYRIYCKDTLKAEADLICVHDEVIDESKPLTIFDPDYTWKRKTFDNFKLKELLVPVYKDGKCIYDRPDIETIRQYCKDQVEEQWSEVKRFENPHNYYVDLSQKLWDIKYEMLSRD